MKNFRPFRNRPDLHSATHRRNLPRWVALAGLLCTLPTLLFVADWTMKSVLRQLHASAADELKINLAYMQSQMDNLYTITRIASTDERVAELIGNPDDRLLCEQINSFLARFAVSAGSLVYILDRRGLVLASGNWARSDAFHREAKGFGPPMRAALSGAVGRYMAMDLSSGRLGYYLAIPIRVQGRISGVAVTKTDPQKLILPQERPLRPFFVTDEHGVIIIASRQSDLFHSLNDLPPAMATRLDRLKPYADRKIRSLGARPMETISAIPVITLVAQNATGLGAGPRPNYRRYVIASADVADTAWRAHQLLPVHELNAKVVQRSLIAVLALLAVLLVLLFAMERWRRLKLIHAQAIRDPLTGLYTRLYMLPSAGALLSAHDRRNIEGVSTILFDLDHFKEINDRYGHSAGDKTLARVGAVLLKECRDSDIPIRYGGEEFLLFVPTGQITQAVQLAERIRHQISALDLNLAGQPESLTISGGVASHQPGETLEKLIDRADSMLYQAKEKGRNQICW